MVRRFFHLPYASVILFAAFCALIGTAGFVFVQHTTAELLREDAKIMAGEWSDYLIKSVPDLAQIAAGKTPSPESMVFFEQAHKLGRVSEFSIYNAAGDLQLNSSQLGKTQNFRSNVFTLRPGLYEALTREPLFIDARRGTLSDGAIYYSDAIVPFHDRGKLAGWLEIRLDQTNRQSIFLAASTRIAATVGLLLAIGPAIGFWYRTRQKEFAERKLLHFANHDPVTGLMNRNGWLGYLSEMLSARSADAKPSALLHIYAEGVRAANEALVPAAVDHVLTTIAERLVQLAGDSSRVARISNDSFALYLPAVEDAVEAAQRVREILSRLKEPVRYEDSNLVSHASIGIAIAPADGKDHIDLSKAAEVALGSARQSGRNNYRFFDMEVERKATAQREMESLIEDALRQGYFKLHFQPVFELRSGKLRSFEALVRLDHPEKGLISPAEFIAVAENTGIIDGIGAWCIEEACRTAANWPVDLTVAVNLSPLQFTSGSLISTVQRALSRARFPAYRLELEVTEGLLLNDDELVGEQLKILQNMGVRVVLDDFGSGYSSLNYLWRFPFAKIKIDQAFVRAIVTNASARGVLRTIIALGRSLGLPITAEGVETEEQVNFLRKLKCDLVQGYLFSRPVPATEVAAIIMKDFAAILEQEGRVQPEADEEPSALHEQLDLVSRST
jgi:diguanylate cyclase (GGDEF)-like protein